MGVSFYGAMFSSGGGVAGRGIQNIEINEEGQMVITYTDGSSQNLGSVVGPYYYPEMTMQNNVPILNWTNNGGLENPDPFEFPICECTSDDDVWVDIGDTSDSGDLEWNEILATIGVN